MAIPCKKVSGFSKAFGYDPEVPFTLNTSTDHAWNIVFVNGEWRPIESTWGAGHINTSNKFEKSFEEVYFLTDPEDFIIKHFPFIDKNLDASLPLQLLKQPWSLEKFNTSLCPNTSGIEWGFECLSHKTQVITVEKECEITFRTRNVQLESVLCHLIEKNTRRDYKQYVLLRRKGDKFTARVTVPAEGKYELELYGKPEGSTGNTHNILITFVLRCQSVLKDVHPYPVKSGVWGAIHDAKRYGFSSDVFEKDIIVTKNGETELRFNMEKRASVVTSLEHAENTGTNLKRFASESYEGNTLVIKVRCPVSGFYKLVLFAKDPVKDTTSHDHVGEFLIDSKKALENAKPFPETYTAAQNYDCLLIEPIIGDLPANQDVRLRLRSDKLVRVMINMDVHKKGGKGEFDITFKTPRPGETLSVYGSPNTDGSLDGIYKFQIV